MKILSFVFFSCFLFSSPNVLEFPDLIDLSNTDIEPEIENNETMNRAFNGAPEIAHYVKKLIDDYSIDLAIETGTYKGLTTLFLCHVCKEVHTAEITEKMFHEAQKNLEFCKNVNIHWCSSQSMLKDILPISTDKFIFFYLDAHMGDECPLLAELEEISKTHKDKCIIMIDDVKVPGLPEISYDSYNGSDCSYEYVKSKIDAIFSKYSAYYLIPRKITSKAKLLFIPSAPI